MGLEEVLDIRLPNLQRQWSGSKHSLTEYLRSVTLGLMHEFSVWLLTLSDLFVNLAAGWFGAALVIPITGKLPKRLNLWLLTYNASLGTVSLLITVLLRKAGGL